MEITAPNLDYLKVKPIMKQMVLVIVGLIMTYGQLFGQPNPFDRINFIIGEWTGTGGVVTKVKASIQSSYQYEMDSTYIKVKNESRFEPTDKKPEGEYHLDRGFISYDKKRRAIIFRQFNNEGYVNQYRLNDSLSNDSLLVFETEVIENFVPGGKARWTIKKISADEIETIFDVSFTKADYTCLGINTLLRK